jgi:hypothetical protein
MRKPMISVILPSTAHEPALIDTLAALVEGVADGVLRDAILVGPESTETDELADAAGATRLIAAGNRPTLLAEAAKIARSDWCFIVTAGLVPGGDWMRALWDGAVMLRAANESGIIPLAARAGLVGSLKTAYINRAPYLTGRPDLRHGVLIRRETVSKQPNARLKITNLGGWMSDRRTIS